MEFVNPLPHPHPHPPPYHKDTEPLYHSFMHSLVSHVFKPLTDFVLVLIKRGLVWDGEIIIFICILVINKAPQTNPDSRLRSAPALELHSTAESSVGITSPFQRSRHRKQFRRKADKKKLVSHSTCVVALSLWVRSIQNRREFKYASTHIPSLWVFINTHFPVLRGRQMGMHPTCGFLCYFHI